MTPAEIAALCEEHQNLIELVERLQSALAALESPQESIKRLTGNYGKWYGSLARVVVKGTEVGVLNSEARPFIEREMDVVRTRIAAIEATFATLKAPA